MDAIALQQKVIRKRYPYYFFEYSLTLLNKRRSHCHGNAFFQYY